MWLSGGTVPPDNLLFGGTVPPDNSLSGGTMSRGSLRIICYPEGPLHYSALHCIQLRVIQNFPCINRYTDLVHDVAILNVRNVELNVQLNFYKS